jgi:phosphosulfolactate synthase (CoM biosynthesis protein A)
MEILQRMREVRDEKMSFKDIFKKAEGVVGKGKDKIITAAAIRMYNQMKKQNRHDRTATDYLNKIIDALKNDRPEEYTELNTMLGGYLAARAKRGGR